MSDYYSSIRNMTEEIKSLRSRANDLRACSKHSGVEFDLIAKADECDEIADRYELTNKTLGVKQ